MRKIVPILLIYVLTACSNKPVHKTPNDLLLSIKNYSCKMYICSYSNKNTTEYSATQSYLSTGQYSMEFLDSENLKLNYENSILNVTSKLFDNELKIPNYTELNQNPLFLSYFINTYFNSEESNNIKITKNSIHLTLPNYNNSLYSAELTFKNNIPYTLTYFDENGNIKVNIIYNEFTFI